ncbi:MAG: hypothetical protein NW218_11345 [Saprospiraceae bacterium]|nr:hypothetical protein [Saprospiraceae bacterium]
MRNHIILNVLLLGLQVFLCLPLYNVVHFPVEYTMMGTMIIFAILGLNEIYLFVKAIRYFLAKKYFVGLALILFVIGTMFAYYFVCMVGFLPIAGITLDGVRE